MVCSEENCSKTKQSLWEGLKIKDQILDQILDEVV
jgi:hypothetical protein